MDVLKPRESRPVAVVMLKAPRAGTVKTRLGAEIGHEAATQIYRILVEHQMNSIPRDWRTEIHFSPADAGAEMQAWLGAAHEYFPQSDGDLGCRLTRAVSGAFDRGAASTVVVGGDCPTLDEACLRRAGDALPGVDVVLGPALDGGYYLVALRRAVPRLFENIPWSTEHVLATSLVRIAETRLQHTLLEPKEDVDDLASLHRAMDTDGSVKSGLRATLQACLPQ